MKKILAISGSTRQNSSNQSILQYIKKEFGNEADIKIFNGIDKLPHFNPDLEKTGFPQSVIDFRAQVDSADGVIICTPEYVFSLPGSLKNAIEWAVSTTIFSQKPVALIVAAASGQKAFESLDLIMTTLEADIPPACKLLIQGIKGKLNQKGQLSDTSTQLSISELMKKFQIKL